MKVVVWVVLLAACDSKHIGVRPDAREAATDGALDAVLDADLPSDPFTTPVGAWTWVDVPGMACGNGVATGIGVNRSDTSDDVVVFFEGGGACWDLGSCFTLNAAVHIQDGFTATTLAAEVHAFPFDRATVPAPLAQPTYVFVPYCTGDIHAGINTKIYDATHTVHHVGATNAQAMIDRVHAALPHAQRVWVIGQSAGGYGATINLPRVRAAYRTAELALLQDSSMFIPLAGNYGAWQSSWTLQFPAACSGCETDFRKVLSTVMASEPTTRIGLLTYDNDTTIKLFFGYGLLDSIVAQVNSLIATYYTAATSHVYEVVGADHTMLAGFGGNPTLATWVMQWASGDAAWADAHH